MTGQPGAISSRRVYNGRVISLDVDTVRFPNGTVGELEMIRHPGASAVVPFLDDPTAADPRIVLIRQYRYAAGDFVFEIPAGRLDKDEAPDACAHRELREETGYSAERMVRMTTFYTTPGFTDESIHLFAASGLTAGSSSLEPDEILDLQVVSLSEAISMVAKGEIKDGKTMIGLLFAAALIRPGMISG
ncbi:MAG: NUDIX hydrolase [Gemmatimonadales bacterium]